MLMTTLALPSASRLTTTATREDALPLVREPAKLWPETTTEDPPDARILTPSDTGSTLKSAAAAHKCIYCIEINDFPIVPSVAQMISAKETSGFSQ